MLRSMVIMALALAGSACAAEPSGSYVIRLDLDEIAAQTAAKNAAGNAAPGFASLGR